MEKPNSNNSIKCRKCGGPHLTIKCGKEVKEEVKEIVTDNINNLIKYINNKLRDT